MTTQTLRRYLTTGTVVLVLGLFLGYAIPAINHGGMEQEHNNRLLAYSLVNALYRAPRGLKWDAKLNRGRQ